MIFSYFSARVASNRARVPWPARILRAFGLALLLGLAGLPAGARTVLDLDAEKQPVALADWGDYWIDEQIKLEAAQVANQGGLAWNSTPTRGIYPLQPGQALWIRFTVPPAPDMERWLLEIP